MGKNKKERKDFVNPGQEQKEVKKLTAKDFFRGEIFTRKGVVNQIPFFLFLFVLLLFYIGNQYQGAKVMKRVLKVEARFKVLRTESISTTFDRMEMSKQSEVVKLVEEKGLPLKEAVLPPFNIEIE